MSHLDVCQVTSFRRPRKTKYDQGMCALDTANKTVSSSSAEDCSLACTRDGACTGFNMNSRTCALYNYMPKIYAHVSDRMFYQVAAIL